MSVSTVKLRLKDRHAAELNRQAAAVNLVWNYCNETQQKAARAGRTWLDHADLCKLTAGSSKLIGLNSQTIQRVCFQYVRSRNQQRKPWLRWRNMKSLGWVPFNQQAVLFNAGAFIFAGTRFAPMHMNHEAALAAGGILSGSFNRDRRGRWYINVPIERQDAEMAPNTRVGVDLGIKALATLSTGPQIVMPTFYRSSEARLAGYQRAKKTKRVTSIHAKIRNRRKDFLHKAAASIAKEFGLIVVGDVSPTKLSQTRMAKSVHDASWWGFKQMLSYKAIRHGGRMLEVSERLTTQTCSSCGALPPERPRGIAGLGIREWTCGGCGATHDRDVNAARNILRLGLETLAEGAAQMRSSQDHQF